MLRSRSPFTLGVLASVLLLASCASVPPPKGEMANADLALRKAEQAEGARFAPLDMRLARDRLEQAQSAMQNGQNEEARRLAEKSEVDALVAEAKARAERRQQAEQEIRRSIEAARSEAERASERVPGVER